MKILFKIVFGFFGLIILLLVGFMVFSWWTTITMDVRYKLTVNVQTPSSVVSGSAVRRVTNKYIRYKLIDLPDQGTPAKTHGEAVVVEIGEQYLFGLIDWSSYNELFEAFPYEGTEGYRRGTPGGGIKYYKSLPIGSKANLPRQYWPTMVMFEDINDPKTVYRVDTDMVQSVTVEITDEKVTRGIVDKYLPWLKDLKSKRARLNGSTNVAIKTNELSDNLGTGAFSTGE